MLTIRGKKVTLPKGLNASVKADVARFLLSEGYTVSEISKAVPMAYSQVHSIWKKMVPTGEAKSSLAGQRGINKQPRPQKTIDETPKMVDNNARRRAAARAMVGSSRIGKLKTPGFTGDIEVGECANCGYDLVVRKTPVIGTDARLILVHVNITPDEYLNTVQFCQGVPKRLLP